MNAEENLYPGEFYDKVNDGLRISKADGLILFCSILIACIGLNLNSVPALIGAMLISPLMAPIIGMGMGLSLFDYKMVKRAGKLLAFELAISLVTAGLYFFISPISYASTEIISRTEPTLWDAIIALVGGAAGVIGMSKRKSNNIIPGVAIATALMPPVCTVAFGLINMRWDYLFGAAYLFAINWFFIILATFIGVRIMKMPRRVDVDNTHSKRINYILMGVSLILLIPGIFSAVDLIHSTVVQSGVRRLVENEFSDVTILSQSIEDDEICLTTVGEEITPTRLAEIEANLSEYNLEGMRLDVEQINDQSDLSIEELIEIIQSYSREDTETTPIEPTDSSQ